MKERITSFVGLDMHIDSIAIGVAGRGVEGAGSAGQAMPLSVVGPSASGAALNRPRKLMRALFALGGRS
jgi:hypothetical protein